MLLNCCRDDRILSMKNVEENKFRLIRAWKSHNLVKLTLQIPTQYASTESEQIHTSEGAHRHEIIWNPNGPQSPQDDTPHPPTTYKTEHPNARYHGGGRAAPRDQNSDDTQQPTARHQERIPLSPRCTQIRPFTNTITYLHLPLDLPKRKTSARANHPRQRGAKTSIQTSNKPKMFPQDH